MLSKDAIAEIIDILNTTYPNPQTELNYDTPFQLLIATILSAQCTDERVNIITSKLFADHPTVEAIQQLPLPDLENYIRSAGLWQTKARNIKKTCDMLLDKFNGKVPRTRSELMLLPGVGRKTANVVLSNAFKIPAFAVDTHVHRVANRLGLAKSNNPDDTERQLTAIIPQQMWNDGHHWLILHGRRICNARQPKCDICPLAHLCMYALKRQSD